MVLVKGTKKLRARIDLEIWKAAPGTSFLSEVHKKFRIFWGEFPFRLFVPRSLIGQVLFYSSQIKKKGPWKEEKKEDRD